MKRVNLVRNAVCNVNNGLSQRNNSRNRNRNSNNIRYQRSNRFIEHRREI